MFYKLRLTLMIIIITTSFLSHGIVWAQHKTHEIGMIWETMFETGSIPSYAPLQHQMTYPGGDFWAQTRKNLAGRGLWIGVTNWTDKFGTFHTNYVSQGGFENSEASEFTARISNKKRVRNRLPRVSVNNQFETRPMDTRDASTKSSTIPADERIETIWATNVGVEVRMRSHAFANQNHNSYIIREYTFTNNGNADGDEDSIELLDQNLQGVYFGFQYYLIPGGDLGHQLTEQNDDWAVYYGNQPGDTLRGLFYLYDGNSSARTSDDIGDPDEFTGEFLSPQYPAIGVLHADLSYNDESDDRSQPYTVNIKPRSLFKTKTAGDADNELYTELSSGSQDPGTVGQAPNPYDSNVREPVGLLSFGPYDIPFEESITIVLYGVVGSISQRRAVNDGQAWLDGTLSFNGLSGDQAKNALLATGKDSLSMHASRAEFAWSIGLENVPDPPPTPDLWINSGPGRIELQWSDVSQEEDPDTDVLDFAGYRIYRAEGKITNIYSRIWECGGESGNDTTTTYLDENVERGKTYFYAVTSFDDGTQNTLGIFPGQPLESSQYSNRNYSISAESNIGASLTLDSVYVVPNPYHLRGMAFGGSLRDEYMEVPRVEDKISFVGLPAIAKIRIFTVHGDLVETIEHPNPNNPSSVPGSSDEAWFNISRSYQIVKSAVYLFHVEGWDKNGKPLGTTTGKFIIIR
jgi:hypothetical protein